jgi:hypothetical protein
VFGNFPIPYPKREFLTDDDNEDKNDSKLNRGSDRASANAAAAQAAAAAVSRAGPSAQSSVSNHLSAGQDSVGGQPPNAKRIRMNHPMQQAQGSGGGKGGLGRPALPDSEKGIMSNELANNVKNMSFNGLFTRLFYGPILRTSPSVKWILKTDWHSHIGSTLTHMACSHVCFTEPFYRHFDAN